ncbi:hypothetical protein N665_0318s0029 [Sinapis alba]|nr:hypothetical protein N665_0318s0029 [Sinapis alba]
MYGFSLATRHFFIVITDQAGVEPDPNIYLIRIYSCERIDQYEHDL